MNLRHDKVRTSERTPPDRKWIPSGTECSSRPWIHKHIRTNQKSRYVEVELHRNTKTSTNMGSPERKQNQGNEEKHTRKRAHVKAEVVHEDGTSSQPHNRYNDDYRREPWNLRQEYAIATYKANMQARNTNPRQQHICLESLESKCPKKPSTHEHTNTCSSNTSWGLAHTSSQKKCDLHVETFAKTKQRGIRTCSSKTAQVHFTLNQTYVCTNKKWMRSAKLTLYD